MFSSLVEQHNRDRQSRIELDEAESNSHDVLSDLSPANVRHLINLSSGTQDGGQQLYRFFSEVVTIIQKESIPDRGMTVICNALSMLLKEALRPSNPLEVSNQQMQDMWNDAFSAAKLAFRAGKTKPAMQVLDVLLSSFHKSIDPLISDSLRTNALGEQLTIIVLGGSVGATKAALTILAQCWRHDISDNAFLFSQASDLVQREPQNWANRLAQYGIAKFEIPSECKGALPLFLSLFLALPQPETRHAAMRLLSFICERPPETWTEDFYSALKQTMELYVSSGCSSVSFQEIFPVIFVDAGQFQAFFESFHGRLSLARLSLLLDALASARKSHSMSQTEVSLILQDALSGAVPNQRFAGEPFGMLLGSVEPEIRATTLGLLFFSRATSEPIPDSLLLLLIQNLDFLFDDGGAYYRGAVISIFAKLIWRLKDSLPKVVQLQPDDQDRTDRRFLAQFMQKVLSYLGPNHTYQRHILTLQVLQRVVEAPKLLLYLQDIDVFDKQYQRSLCWTLLSLVMDPFEDVRELAWILLRNISTAVDDNQAYSSFKRLLRDTIPVLLRDLERLTACSARSDHADGLGRIHALKMSGGHLAPIMSRLTKYLNGLQAFELPSSIPLHGLLLAIRHAISTESVDPMECIIILFFCDRIWDLVQEHLCVDSPEFSQSETNFDQNVGPKDILSFSWRALRDSSLLLQALISNRSGGPQGDHILSQIGSLCFDQLVRLRHRGAFSVVADTFFRCCTTMDDIAIKHYKTSKILWYSQALEQIDAQSDRLTRRSAGLPALIACILQPSDLPAVAEFFHSFIEKASSVVSNTSVSRGTMSTGQEMPQVHAFNCLREVMTNSRFRSVSQQYIYPVLELACSNLSSREWPIRNCALMLLRACLNRLDQQHDTSVMSSQGLDSLTNKKSSSCVELAYNLLELDNRLADQSQSPDTKNEEDHAEVARTFAALDLIARLQLSSDDFVRFRPLIEALLCSTIWAIRERAAELLAKFAGETSIMTMATDVSSPNLISTNRLHGHLTCARLSISSFLTRIEATHDNAAFSELIGIVPWLQDLYHDEVLMPHVRSEALNLINMLFEHCLKLDFNELMKVKGMFNETYEQLMVGIKADGQVLPALALRTPLALGLLLHTYGSEPLASDENRTAFEDFLKNLRSTDPDAFTAVISRMRPVSPRLQSSILSLLAILLSQRDYHDTMHGVMLLTLDMILEHRKDLDMDQLEHMSVALAAIEPFSRETLIAKMKLEGCLLALAVRSTAQATNLRTSFDQWLVSIKFAASDLIDLPTRAAAAESLRILISLSVARTAIQWLGNNLDVLLLLYDLALDDDEDVRQSAAQSTFELLNHCSGGPLTPCPLAARENIMHHLHTADIPAGQLVTIALRKTLATDLHITRYCHRRPVSLLVDRIIRSTSDLFAEEKQNLYVNELEEIRIWNDVLIEISVLNLLQQEREALSPWVISGLKYVLQLLRDQHDLVISFPFGVTYNVDIQCILARLLLLGSHFAGVTQEISELLKEVGECLRESDVHHDILHIVNSVTTQTYGG